MHQCIKFKHLYVILLCGQLDSNLVVHNANFDPLENVLSKIMSIDRENEGKWRIKRNWSCIIFSISVNGLKSKLNTFYAMSLRFPCSSSSKAEVG